MECISFFVPILPGKLEAWKAFTKEGAGPRLEEHIRSRKRLGITREVAALVQTPQGDFTSVFIEAEDLAKVFHAIATSDDPYDVWFRESTAEIHGLTADTFDGSLPAEVYFNYRADAMASTSERPRERTVSSDTD